MSQILTPSLKIERSYKIKKLRELSVAGEIPVKEGQMVKPQDVVGRAELPGELNILRVPEQMGIEVFEVVAGLKVKVGQTIEQGGLICEHAGLFGLFKTQCKSPYSGIIEFINDKTGHIGIRLPSKHIEIKAFLNGKVIAIENKKSVTIESDVTYIQGIFGVGGERVGVLKALNVAPDKIIELKDVPASVNGNIVFGGASISKDALFALDQNGAIGLITGSIDDEVLREYLGYDLGIALTGSENVSLTIIVTEGFGHISLSSKVHRLLLECNNMEASINGATQVRAGALRPEIIVKRNEPAAANSLSHVAKAGLDIGSSVRIIRVPYFGMRGEVVELPTQPQLIESGTHCRVLKAKLEDGRIVTVPRANVEL